MTQRDGTTLLKSLFKRFSIGLGTMALMLIAASAQVSGGAGTVLAKVAHAGEIASSEVADTLHMIDVQFALSKPLYRETDRGDAILILALVFSGIVAFNIWFFRHLHGVYAPSRQASGVASNCR
jgi:hypothetical protein